jgi:hypothetical protein
MGFEVPPQPEKKTRNPRKKAEPKASSKMLAALDFIAHASDGDDNAGFQRYARFANNYASASSWGMQAGHPIEEDLMLCPEIKLLRAALSRAGAALSMSALDSGRLSVSGANGFKAVVPCAPGEGLPPVLADRNIAPIDDRIRDGFKAVLACAREEAETVMETTLLLRANTVVGCDRHLLLEHWHGNDLPPNLLVPHRFAKAVTKIAAKLIGFGWTEGRSITFHFEGGGWIRTGLGDGAWPDVDSVLNGPTPNYQDAPKGLFEAIKAVADFSKDGAVHFHDDKVKSSYLSDGQDGGPVYGASFDVDGLRGHSSFTGRLLKLIEPAAAQIDYETVPDRILFVNMATMMRGVLTKRIG